MKKKKDKWAIACDRMDRKVIKACKKAGHKEIYVDYSAYKGDDIPIDNLDEIAVKGKVILAGYADSFYGGPCSLDYRSPVLENPTWLEVAVHANMMILHTRDLHHVFLEGLEKGETKDGVTEYECSMGS